jgi:hypothetical protein
MPTIMPREVVQSIDSLFGANRSELDSRMIGAQYQAEVHTLLSLLNEVPGELIDLPSDEYLELSRCRAELATTLARWNVGDDMRKARAVGGKDVVECIRRLMRKCSNEFPPPEPELPFIADLDLRLGLQDRLHAAWTDFNAREWMGATVFAANVLEALLVWKIKEANTAKPVNADKHNVDKMTLNDLIDEAEKRKLISADSRSQAHLARDARNLVHPGQAARSGVSFGKATALTALAAVYRVIGDFE